MNHPHIPPRVDLAVSGKRVYVLAVLAVICVSCYPNKIVYGRTVPTSSINLKGQFPIAIAVSSCIA